MPTADYVGRFIALGATKSGIPVAVYGITGRSPSSQARRFVHEQIDGVQGIRVQHLTPDKISPAEEALIVYPAMLFGQAGIAVSNGRQTTDIYNTFRNCQPLEAIATAHQNWDYEPDKPNFTPRISGTLGFETRIPCTLGTGALGIIKRMQDGRSIRHVTEIPIVSGKGNIISTYTGANVPPGTPLPSFTGEPMEIEIRGITPVEVARSFYDTLAPVDPTKDLRVAVAAVFHSDTGEYTPDKIAIINRHQ